MVLELKAKGLRQNAIAARVGLTQGRISQLLREHLWPIKADKRKNRADRQLEELDLDEIADEFGLPQEE